MKSNICLLLVFLLPGCFALRAGEEKLAWSFAQSGIEMEKLGKPELAKDFFYKALAADANCPDALFELAKIFEKEGQTATAANFYARASHLMSQDEKNPAYTSRRAEADRRLRALNPYAVRLNGMLEEYAKDLESIAKKIPDTLTRQEALDRVQSLNLASYLPPDKMPKIDKPAPAKTAVKDADTGSADGRRRRRMSSDSGGGDGGAAVTNVPPEVERDLKKAGWITITGTWTKKKDNIYEVTDGKLEAPYMDGVLQATVYRGQGSAKIMVRNNFGERTGTYYVFDTGFGFHVKNNVSRLFAPLGGYSNGTYRPYMEQETTLGEGNPKNTFLMMISAEGKMEYYLNGNKVKTANYKLAREGPFIIEIKGTMILEDPRAKGQ